ncbi:hypothetical protein GCM10010295_25410 [Streptomyces intermedius]
MVDQVFAEAGLRPVPRVEADSVATLFAHVRTGNWASVVPHTWLHVFGVPPACAPCRWSTRCGRSRWAWW